MGTTADKLQNILNAKNAIKEKFSIGDDVKFIDYAKKINAGGSDSDETQFYRCTQVIPEEQWGYLIITSGNTSYTPMNFPDYFKYAYVLMDSAATGTARQWVSASPFDKLGVNSLYMIRFNADAGKWCVCHGANINGVIEYLKEGTDYPWVNNLDDSNGYPSSTCVLRSNMLEGFYVCLDSQNALSEHGYIFYGSNGHYTCNENNYTLTLSDSGACTVYNSDGGIIYSFPSAPGATDGGVIYFMANPVRPKALSGRWGGVKILKTSEGYSEGDSFVTLPYVDGVNLIPQVGGIYDSETRISAAQMHPNLYGANAADFYLCGYVNRNYVTYDTFVVSGFPEAPFVGGTYTDYDTWETKDLPADVANRNPNGTYTLQNPDAQYVSEYYWQSENGCVIDHWYTAMGQPAIYPGKEYNGSSNFFYVSFEDQNGEYPVPDNADSYTWWYSKNGANDAVVAGGSVTVPVPPEVEKYWEGYKLVLNDAGKYDLAVEKTKLTYADYMPVTGRIYDAACTLEITNADLTEDALWACPQRMTSNENDEWKVTSESPIYGGEIFNAFDEDVNTAIHFNYTDKKPYIQWQNKKRPVYLKEIYGVPGGGDYGYAWDYYKVYILGSNDGETWEQLFYGNWTEDGNWSEIGRSDLPKRKIILEQPHGMYFYYKIIKDTTGSGFNIHYLQAFCQSSREVPK